MTKSNLTTSTLRRLCPTAKGLGDLYRQTYKYTACGPWLSARIQYIKVIESDGFGGDMPFEKEVVEWVHSDDLYSLGTWADMDSQGVLRCLLLLVDWIVAWVRPRYRQHQHEVKQLDEEPDVFAKRFDDAVEAVNAEKFHLE
jgi:hypothetical protein